METELVSPAVYEAPAGPSAADLIAWWSARAQGSATGTEHGYFAVCRDVLERHAARTATPLDQVDVRLLDVGALLMREYEGAWSTLALVTVRNYAGRLRRGIAAFHIALDTQTPIHDIRHRPRVVRASGALPPGGGTLSVPMDAGGSIHVTFTARPAPPDLHRLHQRLDGLLCDQTRSWP